MCIAAPEKNLIYVHQVSEGWRLFCFLCLTLQICSWAVVIYWSGRRWGNHPISRTLQAHALGQSGWGAVAVSINTEFRRIDMGAGRKSAGLLQALFWFWGAG